MHSVNRRRSKARSRDHRIDDTPHHFNTEEITYAEFAADQFALALWTIQQESEIQKQLKVANTLVNIERALSETERVGIQNGAPIYR